MQLAIHNLYTAARFFVIIAAELLLLFVGISFLVGLLQEYIPAPVIQKVLGQGRNKILGNVVGAGFGALTPFCSCSTIPITLGLLNSGVPFGAAMSFLIASPLLNPVILVLLAGLLGVRNMLIYAAITFPAAVFTGLWWEKMGLAAQVKKVRQKSSGEGCPCGIEVDTTRSRIGRAFQGAVAVFRQVLPWLLLGAATGSLIYGFVPQDLVTRLAGPQSRAAIPAAAIIGVPMYIRVETILPISNVLLSKGMSTGAVMALIIGGAGASIPEISLLGAIFKPRLVVAFVLTVLVVAILAGSLFMLLA